MDAAEPHRERSTNHPLTPVFPAAMPGILRETTQRHPQASALDDGQGALSYRELMACAIAAAVRLQLAGVHHGDRVGVRMASGSRELYIRFSPSLRPAAPTSRSTPTIPRSGPNSCFARRACAA